MTGAERSSGTESVPPERQSAEDPTEFRNLDAKRKSLDAYSALVSDSRLSVVYHLAL